MPILRLPFFMSYREGILVDSMIGKSKLILRKPIKSKSGYIFDKGKIGTFLYFCGVHDFSQLCVDFDGIRCDVATSDVALVVSTGKGENGKRRK